MRRLIIWVGVFALVVWATLRALRDLDQPATDAIDPVSPRTEGITPASAESSGMDGDGIVPPTDSMQPDSAPIASQDSQAADEPDFVPLADPSAPDMDAINAASDDPLTSAEPQFAAAQIEAYCARCRKRQTLNDVQEETTANGRRAARGACSVCGTTVFTFLSAK